MRQHRSGPATDFPSDFPVAPPVDDAPTALAHPVKIRPATPADFDAIVALSRSSRVFSEAELAALAVDLPACDPEAGDGLMVAMDEGAGPLGFVQYSPASITDGTWFIYWIAVAKHTHGRGIGARLLRHAEEHVLAQGGRIMLIETSSKPAYAATRSFYLGKGYIQVGQIPDYYADGDDLCIFQRRL